MFNKVTQSQNPSLTPNEPHELSLLTSRRGKYLRYGMSGGSAGSVGRNTLLKATGERVELDNCCHLELAAHDRLQIETPWGGGFSGPL